MKGGFKEGAETAGRSQVELMFHPMNDVPNPTRQWWKEDMGQLYRDFAQGTPPQFVSSTKLIRDNFSLSVLLWRNTERDRVVEGNIPEIP